MLYRCKNVAIPVDYEPVCLRCLKRILSVKPKPKSQAFSTSPRNLEDVMVKRPPRRIFRRGYFSANALCDGPTIGEHGKTAKFTMLDRPMGGARPRGYTIEPLQKTSGPSLFSHDIVRRIPQALKALKRGTTPRTESVPSYEPVIPPDASSRLSTRSSRYPPMSVRRHCLAYLALSKPRLSFLIVLTTASAYSLYPVPAVLMPSITVTPSLSALTLVFLTSGTALCTASANALNMLIEPEHDAKMSRTRNRPLVRGILKKRGALLFAGISGILGVGGLWFGVNPTVAFLGGFNIFLYAGVYTPMKRISAFNTWVGAIVGGIPPLMGWAAAAGQSATGNGDWQELLLSKEQIGGWLLAALLVAWQFPHFNALSWSIREEYRSAGYRMLAWINPKMNARVALRYSLMLFPICIGLTWYGVTDQGFLVTSSLINCWIVREAYKFWAKAGHKGTARGLFWASVWHLPVVLVLAMAHKKGLWEGIWRRVTGELENEDEDIWIYEDEVDEVVSKNSELLS